MRHLKTKRKKTKRRVKHHEPHPALTRTPQKLSKSPRSNYSAETDNLHWGRPDMSSRVDNRNWGRPDRWSDHLNKDL